MPETDAILEAAWTAAGSSYTMSIIDSGSGATAETLYIDSNIKRDVGDPNYDPLEPFLETVFQFSVIDRARFLRKYVDDHVFGDLTVLFKKGSSTIFKGYLKMDFQGYRIQEKNPRFTVTAFDGIASLAGFTWDQAGNKTVRELIWAIANKIGLGLKLNIYFEWKHDGADSSTEPPDALRSRLENLLIEAGSYLDALNIICEYYLAQFFQSGGEWHFMQRDLRGADLTQYVVETSGSSGTTVTGVDKIDVLTGADFHDEDSNIVEWPATARISSTQKWAKYKLRNADGFVEGEKYWDVTSPFTVPHAEGRQIGNTAVTMTQEVGFTLLDTAFADRDKLVFAFKFTAKVAAAATGSGDVEFAEVILTDIDGNQWWLQNTGNWSSGTQVVLTESIDLGSNQGAEVDFDSSILSIIVPDNAVSIVVKLLFNSDAGSGGVDLDHIIHKVYDTRPVNPDEEDDDIRPEEFVFELETGKPGEERKSTFGLGDASSKHLAPGVLEYYDGTDWIKTTDWDGAGQHVLEKRNKSISDQFGSRVTGYNAMFKFGFDFDISRSFAYDNDSDMWAEVFVPVYVSTVWKPYADPQSRAVAYNLAGSLVESLFEPTSLYIATESSYRVATRGSSLPFTQKLLATTDSGRDIDSIKVDHARGFIFGLEYASGDPDTKYLTKRSTTDGSLIDTIVQWPNGENYTATIMALGRISRRIYIIENGTSTNTPRIRVFDYDGNVVETLVSDSNAILSHACLSSDEKNFYYWRNDAGIGTDYYKRRVLATATTTNLHTPGGSQGSGTSQQVMLADAQTGGAIFSNRSSTLVKFDYPAGTVETTVTSAIERGALAIDRFNKELYHIEDLTYETIGRIGYDGSGAEQILDLGVDIRSLCWGFN